MAYIEDMFTDADGTLLTAHTGDSGVTWSLHPGFMKQDGDWEILANRASGNRTDPGTVLASPPPPVDTFDIDVEWHVLSEVNYPTICWYTHPTDQTAYCFRRSSSSGNWELLRWTDGTHAVLATQAQAVINGTTYDVHIEVRGSTFTVLVGGVEVCSVTDATNPTSGHIAVQQFGGTGPERSSHFDALTVTVISDPPVVSAGADATITAGQTFSRTATFTDADSTSWTATVDYGEGAGPVAAAVNQGAKTVALSHSYSTPGIYTVTVEVDDGEGGVGSDSFTVTVQGMYIVAGVTGTDASAPAITLAGGA